MKLNPDHIVRRLWHLRDRTRSPRSPRLYEVTGGVWAASCHCGGERHSLFAGIERCTRCGSPWREIESRVPRSRRGGARNGVEDAFAELAYCAGILARVPQPAQILYEYHLDPSGGGAEWSQAEAIKRGWLMAPISLSRYYRYLHAAREVIEIRLRLGGRFDPIGGNDGARAVP